MVPIYWEMFCSNFSILPVLGAGLYKKPKKIFVEAVHSIYSYGYIVAFFEYGMDVQVDHENNIFSTLFITAVFITLLFSGHWKAPHAFLLILLWQTAALGVSFFWNATVPSVVVSAVTGCAFNCECGVKWCVLGCLIYHIKNNKKALAVEYTGWCLICKLFCRFLFPYPEAYIFWNGIWGQRTYYGQFARSLTV